MEYRLYLTESKPNGTNDLVIANIDHEIKACVDEVTFGYPAFYTFSGEDYLRYSVAVWDGEFMKAMEPEDREDEQNVICIEVTIDDIKRFLACSPCDPEGKDKWNEVTEIINEVSNG